MVSVIFKISFQIKNLFKNKKLSQINKKLNKAQNFTTWLQHAQVYDDINNTHNWRNILESNLYNYQYLQEVQKNIKFLIHKNNIEELISYLRIILSRNFSHINHEQLYNKSLSGTKKQISEFYHLISQSLSIINKSDYGGKHQIFCELQWIYGRSCLMLSGGASLGLFHLGVVSNLLEQNLMPKIITGASVGSIIASFVCTKTEEELKDLFSQNLQNQNFTKFHILEKGSIFQKLKHLFKKGYIAKNNSLKQFIKEMTSNLTFEEAYSQTGFILNITVSETKYQKYRMLNYITAPKVLIWSATLASCSFPFIYKSVSILKKGKNRQIGKWPSKKKFFDGSFGADLPKEKISVLFNVQNFIVSQTNPFIVPFLNPQRLPGFSLSQTFFQFYDLLVKWIKSEFLYRLNVLDQFDLIPNRVFMFFNLFLQDYNGNVNIRPQIRFIDFFYVFESPTYKLINYYIKKGRRVSFYHLNQIKDFKNIEDLIEDYKNETILSKEEILSDF